MNHWRTQRVRGSGDGALPARIDAPSHRTVSSRSQHRCARTHPARFLDDMRART